MKATCVPSGDTDALITGTLAENPCWLATGISKETADCGGTLLREYATYAEASASAATASAATAVHLCLVPFVLRPLGDVSGRACMLVNSSRTSCIVCQRCSGSLLRHVRMIQSSESGNPVRTSASGVG